VRLDTGKESNRPAHRSSVDTDARRALADLFEQHVDLIFGFVFARCGSREVSQDVVSETFAEAARCFKAHRGNQVTRPWLLHVARLRLIDHWRRTERHRRRLERAARLETRSTNQGFVADTDPCILEALERVSPRQRAALVLRYLDDYSVQQVADALDLSYQGTESLLARGRKSLLDAYKDVAGS
jgi:RNA polymerase sigma-70 factor (ECF subfamily)